jgi:hypothetical protein
MKIAYEDLAHVSSHHISNNVCAHLQYFVLLFFLFCFFAFCFYLLDHIASTTKKSLSLLPPKTLTLCLSYILTTHHSDSPPLTTKTISSP